MKVGINTEPSKTSFRPYEKTDGLVEASVRAGLNYERYRPDIKYDVVINWEPFEHVRDISQPRGSKLTVFWLWDTYRTNEYTSYIGANDVVFRAHATHYNNEEHHKGKRVYWCPPAVDMSVFKRTNWKPKYDIVWVGKERNTHWFDQLEKHFNLHKVFNRLDYPDYVKALNEGKLVLNVPVAGETNKRVMEAMAIGPALMPWGQDYTLLACADHDFVLLDDIDKVKGVLRDEKRLKQIARNGRNLVRRMFTFDKQLERVDRILRMEVSKREV